MLSRAENFFHYFAKTKKVLYPRLCRSFQSSEHAAEHSQKMLKLSNLRAVAQVSYCIHFMQLYIYYFPDMGSIACKCNGLQ